MLQRTLKTHGFVLNSLSTVKRMTEPYLMNDRSSTVEDAKGSSFLDAVFLIVRFNRSVNFGRIVPDIHAREVWESFDASEYESAVQRVTALLMNTAAVGASFHKYAGSRPFEIEVAAMKTVHPGFSERTYDIVIRDNAVAMR
jgi:hypothetical protein